MAEKHTLLGDASRGLAQFLEVDLDALEDQLIESVREAADPTKLEYEKFKSDIHMEDAQVYLIGDKVQPGLWQCCGCNQTFELAQETTLRACRRCQGQNFRQRYYDED